MLAQHVVAVLFLLAFSLPGQTARQARQVAKGSDLIEVGRDHWLEPWVPDLKAGSGRLKVALDRRPDVLILGDGYLAAERSRFVRDVEQWYEKFLALTPWQQLRGAIRVRGLWTESAGRATADGQSHYRMNGSAAGDDTAARIHAALRTAGCNPARRDGELTHTTVIMLIRDGQGRNPSGLTRAARDPESRLQVRVGYGAYTHHEFGHAYGGLRDEYIKGEGSRAVGRTPDRLSLLSLSNLSHRKDPERVPWKHLMPGSAINPDPDSMIGRLWIGGGAEVGVWHSEARCMMNGRHENWDLAKERRGVDLRDRDRFCFWCEEILVAKTWQRTGLFGDTTDGVAMYARWEREIRPGYQKYFEVERRIAERNALDRAAGYQEARLVEAPLETR